jgi:hypothetical protein
VDERIVRVHQIHHAAVLAHDAVEEQLRFLFHRLPEVVVEIRERGEIGVGVLQVAQMQPLLGEIVDQRSRPRIGA